MLHKQDLRQGGPRVLNVVLVHVLQFAYPRKKLVFSILETGRGLRRWQTPHCCWKRWLHFPAYAILTCVAFIAQVCLVAAQQSLQSSRVHWQTSRT
jgi:hypothetical protein